MKNKKKLSFMLVVLVLVLIMSNIIIKANAVVNTKPMFEVEVSVSPTTAGVGEDVTVSGVIKPQPFELEIPKREVVLVLDVSGSMSGSRIANLKEAANNFIARMNSVSGLQVAIVAYSSEAVINPNGKSGNKTVKSIDVNSSHSIPNYISASNGFLPITDSRLSGMINNLEALGGTNTGEGLRKAQFVFNSGTAGANKTIVFMSDGEPTFYSARSSTDRNYYTTIDNTNPTIAGPGSSNTTQTLGYSTTIGGLIKDNVDNVFSIGYELGSANSSGNTIMRSIHNSMGGVDSNFFATSEGAIDSVMQQIATNIIDTYKISNIKLNLSFSSGITLADGTNSVNINEVTYRKVSEINGKARYEASNIPFSFIIKGSEEVINYNIFNNSNITYPWNNETLTANLPQTFITINQNNILPNMQATLLSATPNPAYPGEEVEITYRITPEEFTSKVMNTDSGAINEAIFITDLSQMMTQGNRFSVIQNAITNRVLNNTTLNKTKFGVIGYNSSVSIGDRNSLNNPKDVSMKNTTDINSLLVPLFDISNGDSKDGFRQLFQSGKMTLSSQTSSNSTRNIDAALTMAKNTFNKFGTANNRKAIVLINAGNVNYTSGIVQDIKNQGYKVISLDISGANNTNLQSFHQDLGGDTNDYLIGKIDGGNYNAVDSDMTKVADRLISGVINKPYPPIYPKLNFDLNNNFQYVSNSSSSNITNATLNGEKLVLDLSPINYNYFGRTTDNNYKYTASEMTVSFRVKPKSGLSGELSFASNPPEVQNLKNFILYNRFSGTEVRRPIDTPRITINNSNIQHGVYEGITNPSPIYSGNTREFAKGAMVPMAALFNTVRNENNIRLTISPQLTVKDSAKIYSVGTNGELQFIANMSAINNVYSYNLNVTSGTKILVLYNVILPESAGTHTNTIYVGAESKDAEIKVKDESLPDLF